MLGYRNPKMHAKTVEDSSELALGWGFQRKTFLDWLSTEYWITGVLE
jgi:hypothetical protein